MADTIKETGNPILTIFSEILRKQKTVELLNTFHSFLISSHAKIHSIEGDRITLNVEGYQAVCIALEKHVYIQNELLNGTIRAEMVTANISEKWVTLDHFTTEQTAYDKRKIQRVQPEEPVPVVIFYKDRTISGTMADLSLEGVGLFTIGAYVDEQLDLLKKEEIDLEINLPIVDQIVRVNGTITNIQREKDIPVNRLGVKFQTESINEMILLDYISIRQAEILQELETIYNRMVMIDT